MLLVQITNGGDELSTNTRWCAKRAGVLFNLFGVETCLPPSQREMVAWTKNAVLSTLYTGRALTAQWAVRSRY